MDIRPNWNYCNLPVTLTEFRIMPYLVGQMKAVPTYIGFYFILKPAWRNTVFARI